MRAFAKLPVFVFAIIALSVSLAFGQDNKMTAAPDFELQDIHQDMVKFSDYNGKQPVLLFFWATWCPYCEKELTVLRDRYAGLKKDGVEAIAIDVGETADVVIAFTQNYFLPYRVLMDKDTSVSRSYGVVGVPTYVLVDTNGNIVFQDNYFPQAEYKKLLEQEKAESNG